MIDVFESGVRLERSTSYSRRTLDPVDEYRERPRLSPSDAAILQLDRQLREFALQQERWRSTA